MHRLSHAQLRSRPATSSSRWSARLEAGGTTLEESLALWERGERLATICQEALDGARQRLDAADGGPHRTAERAQRSASVSDSTIVSRSSAGAEP